MENSEPNLREKTNQQQKKPEIALVLSEESKDRENHSPALEQPSLKKAQSLVVSTAPLSEQSINVPEFQREAKTPALVSQGTLRKGVKKGSIEMIIGPMFAGKSTELLRRVRRLEIAGRKCLHIKYVADTRYDAECITTHDNNKIKAVCVKTLAEIGDKWKNYDVIGVDEGQFFTDVVPFCETLAQNGKVVITSALSGTFQREEFNSILELLPKAEKVKMLNAICKFCGEKAAFTLRTTTSTELELVGGSEDYVPTCRECFNFKTKQQTDLMKAHSSESMQENLMPSSKEEVDELKV